MEYQKAMEWGIDLIQTDHPLRLLRAIELWEDRKSGRPAVPPAGEKGRS